MAAPRGVAERGGVAEGGGQEVLVEDGVARVGGAHRRHELVVEGLQPLRAGGRVGRQAAGRALDLARGLVEGVVAEHAVDRPQLAREPREGGDEARADPVAVLPEARERAADGGLEVVVRVPGRDGREEDPVVERRPLGRAVAAVALGPLVLVHVDEHVEPAPGGEPRQPRDLGHVGLVEPARRRLERLPGDAEADRVHAPRAQPRDVLAVEARPLGRAVGVIRRDLVGDVDAVQHDGAAAAVDERAALDLQRRRGGARREREQDGEQQQERASRQPNRRATRAAPAARAARAPGPARRAARTAARRPPSARRPRSPRSATRSASAPSRRARVRAAATSSPARCASSAATSSSIPDAGGSEETATTARVALAERAQRRAQVAPRAQRDLAEVGLGHHEHVGDLHDPGLEELQGVAGARLDHDRGRVGRLGDLRLGLADADRLDHDDVEGGGQRLGGRAGGGGEPAEPLARRGRADEQPAVGRVGVDPRAVAEQRRRPSAWTSGRRRARRRCGRRRARRARARSAASTCPAPGGPVTPTTCAGASPPSRAGETSASSAATCSRAAGVRFSIRFSAAGAAARSRSRSRAPSSAPLTGALDTIRAGPLGLRLVVRAARSSARPRPRGAARGRCRRPGGGAG